MAVNRQPEYCGACQRDKKREKSNRSGKNGTKRHIYVDSNGMPIGVALSGANEHDVTTYRECINSCVINRPSVSSVEQHLFIIIRYIVYSLGGREADILSEKIQ